MTRLICKICKTYFTDYPEEICSHCKNTTGSIRRDLQIQQIRTTTKIKQSKKLYKRKNKHGILSF